MNERLFRKASLERLASPDQLDEIARISTSKTWTALIGLLLLTAIGGVWAFAGSIPTTVAARGMIVRSGGLVAVVSRGAGLVVELKVDVGQHVSPNQVVARIAQPALVEKLRQIAEAMSDLRQRQQVELSLKREQSKLAIEAIEHQRTNTVRDVVELQKRATLVQEQIPVTDQLYAKGLMTKHQTIVARQNLVDMQAQIEEHNAKLNQFDQQEDAARMEVRQAELDMQREQSALLQSRKTAEEELSRVGAVVAPVEGEVVELKVSPGGTVIEDAAIVAIQPAHDTALEVVAYVPAAMAKECRPSMPVQISPSVAKPEEFGYMRGHVTFVADYPSTTAAMMRQFQNESLVSALSGSGPVSEIRASLERDPSTVSGFRWSSSQGPAIRITSGTITDVHVVTRVQKPAALLLPWLRRQSGVD